MIRTVRMTTTVVDAVSLRPGQVTFFISVRNSCRKPDTRCARPAPAAFGRVSSVAVRVPGRRSSNLSFSDLAMAIPSPAARKGWQARRDSNPQPADLESAALAVRATGLSSRPLLGFLVRRMLPACRAEFLQLQLVRHGLLVLRRGVVPHLALGTRQRDDVPHSAPRPYVPLFQDFRDDAG